MVQRNSEHLLLKGALDLLPPLLSKFELGVDADVRFHLSIYQATQNTVLSHIASTLLALLHQTQRVTRQVMFTETMNKERLLRQHAAILAAIRERNPERAREAILTHLDYAENYFVTRPSKGAGTIMSLQST